MSTFVIIRPGGWGHVHDDPHTHLVVEVEEWVQVYHGEKESYDSVTPFRTYDAAHNERNRRNDIPADLEEEPQVEVAVEIEGEEVQWLGAKAS